MNTAARKTAIASGRTRYPREALSMRKGLVVLLSAIVLFPMAIGGEAQARTCIGADDGHYHSLYPTREWHDCHAQAKKENRAALAALGVLGAGLVVVAAIESEEEGKSLLGAIGINYYTRFRGDEVSGQSMVLGFRRALNAYEELYWEQTRSVSGNHSLSSTVAPVSNIFGYRFTW